MEGADKDEFEELLRPHLGVAARLAFGLLQDRAEGGGRCPGGGSPHRSLVVQRGW